MRRILILCVLLLVACNREELPQGPTQAETEQLNEAEEMLNGLAKEEGAAPEGTTPSTSTN